MRSLLARAAAALAVAVVAASAPAIAAADEFELTPVTRVPFPERGYVVDVGETSRLDASRLEVRENGVRVRKVRVTPVVESGLRSGVVLALDASDSMAGEPFQAALAAARAFLVQRDTNAWVGLIAFNGQITRLQAATQDAELLERALSNPPELAYGTRIYDAVADSIAVLRTARVSAGSVVLLSDGADVGSEHDLDAAVADARKHRVRIFTVGLRSGAFDDTALRSIAERTGGRYAEARSAAELEAVYAEFGRQLANEYLIRYRSDARPETRVQVSVSLAGRAGAAKTAYVAPTPAALPPFHRSVLSRFLLSSGSLLAVALVFAVFTAFILVVLLRGPKRTLVDRVGQYAGGMRTQQSEPEWLAAGKALARTRYTGGWWLRLERDLEIARLNVTPRQLASMALAGTVVLFIPLVLFSPVLALLCLVPPVAARAFVRHKVRRLRNEFSDQFPPNLQVLASALRAGHSFSGALGVVVENAHEPARSELRRVLRDDQLGVQPEEAMRRMAQRMASRDVEQVALLAELQRTSGGNSAEVLDTVVETIRERGELRRLVRTLTAQGRMARWILTLLPVFAAAFLFLLHPDVMQAFVASGGGQVALVVAALMVAAGSLVIQRIIDIDV